MNSRIVILLVFMLTSVPLLQTRSIVYSSPGTTITFNPKNNYVPSGQTAMIEAKVVEVNNLNAWQLFIGFNPKILNCISVTVPPDNIFGGNYILLTPDINNARGIIRVFCFLNGQYGVNGTGKLCNITFQCLQPGISALEIIRIQCTGLCGTYLQEPDYDLIAFVLDEGMVEVTSQGFQENSFNPPQPILIYSNSSIMEFGLNETWKQILYKATGTTGTAGSATVVTPKSIIDGPRITVLVSGLHAAYTLSKNASHYFIYFPYQHSTRDIALLVTLLGDVTGDRKVRVDDVLSMTLAFGTEEGYPQWDPTYDLNGDFKVRVDDVLLVALEFGGEWHP